MPPNKIRKAPIGEPLGISPKRAAELADVSLATMFEWIKDGLVASTLVRGRRIIDFRSFKRRIAPDKVRQVRRGVHNRDPVDAQAAPSKAEKECREARRDPRQRPLPLNREAFVSLKD